MCEINLYPPGILCDGSLPWWISHIHQGKHAKWTVILHTWQMQSSESWVDQLPHLFTHESKFTRVFTHSKPLVNQALSVKVWPKDTRELVYLSHFSLISVAGFLLSFFFLLHLLVWLQCTKNSLQWQLYNIVHINWGQLPERPRFHKSNLNLEEPFNLILTFLRAFIAGHPGGLWIHHWTVGGVVGGGSKETSAHKTLLLK